MKIEKQFELANTREKVWDALGDVYLVAQCLPGAAIIDQLEENRYQGRFSVKLGPLAASFDGEVVVERNREHWTGVVSGKGSDTRSSSRASGSMTYRLAATGPDATKVDVVSEIQLAGALAQFGKAGVIQEVANRITTEFVRNFESKLASENQPRRADPASAGGRPQELSDTTGTQSLNAGALVWAIIKDRVLGLFRRLKRRENP
jgi:uncharacterized protein